jgi:hypothetical protein
MTKPTGRAEIESLLAERGRFETWLDQLSAKASTMPAHVVERVRADYQERLDKVVASLQVQADGMRADVSALDERVRVLDVELAAKKDARAEDELRALVGEYDGGAWEKKAAEHDSGIGALESERAEREAEHRRVQQLLTEAARPARPATPVSSPVIEAPSPETRTVAEPTPEVTTTAMAAEPMKPAPPDPAATAPPESESQPRTAKRPSPFDEIGFMRAVVGRTTPFAGVDLPSEEDLAPRRPTPPPEKESSSVAPEPPAPVPPPEPPLQASAERKAVPSFEAPPIPEAPIVAPVRSSSPSIPMIADEGSLVDALRTSAAVPDAARTLKCQECGWMNYPTEWYCEKCGGELAAF